MSAKKIYLYAKQGEKSIEFRSHDDTIVGYWAGGNEKDVKFIIDALIRLYGVEQGADIYEKYNAALLEVSNTNKFLTKTACITLYQKDNTHDGTKRYE